MGHIEHKKKASQKAGCFILTVSDTRTQKNDESGNLLAEEVEKKGHSVISRCIVRDEIREIRKAVRKAVSLPRVQAVLINGGTGIAKRDCTIEAIAPMLDKRLDGFGELFRYLSYRQIGPPAFLSRAVAGVSKGKIIISMPGSTNAVRLALRRLILPELSHLVWEVSK
jgi:molybdenum cofactor biosynthesis protein B